MLKTLATAVAVGTLMAVAVLAVRFVSMGTPAASAQTPVDIAIDMNTTGNDARLTGFTDPATDIQDCGEITGAGTLDIDVILPPPGVDAADGINGYQFNLLYDPLVVSVTAENLSFLLTQAAGSSLFPLSDAKPDTDGSYTSAVIEIGGDGIEPGGPEETGPGVIARLTLTGVAPGTSSLTLSNVILTAANNLQIPNGTITNATVSVDQACTFVTPQPDVRIAGLACNNDPEIVRIKNFGTAAQDLTGWLLRSDPVGSGDIAFDAVANVGSLDPGQDASIWSNSGSAAAQAASKQFQWDMAEKFRNGDSTDFAQIVDAATTEVDKENCVLGDMAEDTAGGYNQASTEDDVTGTCGDSVDNGADTVADTNDSDCHADGDAGNPATYVAALNEDSIGACGDGTDNGGDGLADDKDPDCLGSLSTDGIALDGVDAGASASNIATEADPVEVTANTPNAGTIRLEETDITQAPPGDFTFIGQQVSITAPVATADDPLIVEFHIDVSQILSGADDTTLDDDPAVEMFKDGVQVPDCADSSGMASPDPCVLIRERDLPNLGGDAKITVLTSTGSEWNFGQVPVVATPTPTPTSRPTATVLPPTGDSIPTGGGDGSALPWLFVGLGAAVIFAAGGYVTYGRARGRLSR